MKIEIVDEPVKRFKDEYASALQTLLKVQFVDESRLISAVAEGPGFFHNAAFRDLTVRLSELLADRGEILEIDDQGNLDERRDNYSHRTIWLGKATKGTIAYKGYVQQLTDLKGGNIHIEGDVRVISDCKSGVVYVKGDVGVVGENNSTVIIVDGKIGNVWTGYPRPSFAPPAFVFTSEKPDRLYEKGIYTQVLPEVIRDWRPDQVKHKGLVLAQSAVRIKMDDLTRRLNRIGDPKDLAKLMEGITQPYFIGYSRGDHEGTVNALGPGD